MGIVSLQRNIIRHVVATGKFRKTPNAGFENYCGGGSGFAIMNVQNFAQWRNAVSCLMKGRQILEAFSEHFEYLLLISGQHNLAITRKLLSYRPKELRNLA